MAGINDCIDECSLEENGSGLLQVRLAPGGGITCEAGGLTASSAFVPHFEKADGEPFAVPSPLFGGLINPTLPGPGGTPVTSVMTGAPFALPAGGVWAVLLNAYANMALVPPAAGDSECGMSLLASIDGVNYNTVHAVNYLSISGRVGSRGGYQRTLQVNLVGGTSFTPTFVINYNRESAANDADFIKATNMQYQFTVHKVS